MLEPQITEQAYSDPMTKARKSPDTNRQEELIPTIDALRAEIRVLREAIDALRDEVQYLVRNPDIPAWRPAPDRLQLTSIPLDPAAPDFGQRVNAVPAEQVDALRAGATGPAQEPRGTDEAAQRELF